MGVQVKKRHFFISYTTTLETGQIGFGNCTYTQTGSGYLNKARFEKEFKETNREIGPVAVLYFKELTEQEHEDYGRTS